MKLSCLLQNVCVKEISCDADCDVTHLCSDSRCVLKGGAFICIKGTRLDGHDFINEAITRGACVIIASDKSKLPHGTPCVVVDDTRLAEAHIWNAWYSDPARDMTVVAVTGTNGKTSTVFMLKEILSRAGRKVGVITTLRAMAGEERIGCFGGSSVSDAHSAMTTPDPEYLYGTIYLMKQKGVDMLVFEASSHALAQHKLDPLKIDAAVFTNLSAEHLDFHGTMEEYFAAKARLSEMAECLIINADDAYMSRLAYANGGRGVVRCSADPTKASYGHSDVLALRQTFAGLSGVEYIYFSKEAVFKLKANVPGKFTVYNSLLAAATAIKLGVPPSVVRDGMASLKSVDGRLEEIAGLGGVPFRVFIDYAHTPDALENLLVTVRQVKEKKGRIILLFGCGGDRDRSKRRKMGAIASKLADFVIVTADNSRSEDTKAIIKEIASGLDAEKPHAVIDDRRRAIEYAVEIAGEGDIVLLAGKGHEKYEITSKGKLPFDETEIVRHAVADLEKQ